MQTLAAGKCLRRGAVLSWLSVAAVGLASPAGANAPPGPGPGHGTVLSARQVRYQALLACPTTLDQIGRVVIPVMVDGRGPFRFVVDTGAGHSTVSPRLVRALKLDVKHVPRIEVQGITGSAAIPAVRIRTLSAGSLVIRNTYAPVLRTPMMAGADGILGVAGLPKLTLLVNFEDNKVQIARYLGPDVRFDYSRVHTLTVAGGLMAIPSYVGDIRTLAIIDTGSERTLANKALREALHVGGDSGRPEPVTIVYGATRQVEMGRMATSPAISVGPLRVLGAEMIFGDFHIFKVWHLDKRPAVILGMDVLGTVSALGFDFRQHDLFVASARGQGNFRFRTRAIQANSKAAH